MGASPKAMYPIIAIRGVLAQRMVTMEYTILLLQQMGIIATSGTCRQCQGDLEEQYKSSTNNKRYWHSGFGRTGGAVLENSSST